MTTTNDDADVLVVGAGVLGASAALHLLGRRAGRVLLLDAGQPGRATSSAGAGFIGRWAAGYASFFEEPELVMEDYGLGFYEQLSRSTGDIDCRANGNLYLATTDEGWRRWVEPVVTHPLSPAGTCSLTPAQVAEVTGGVIAAGSVTGGALHPGGLQISAGRATRAVVRRFVGEGGEVRPDTPVTGLLVEGHAVRGVRTERGDLRAGRVVLACGAWTNAVLADVATTLPLLRMVATRAISPPSGVGDAMPTVMVPDLFGLWLREHRGGLTWGNGDGYAPIYDTDQPGDAPGQPREHRLVERLDAAMSATLRRLVPGHDTSIGWWLQGMPCMTPDRVALVGPVPGIEDLWVLTGDNEVGVTHGPGLGRLLADLVVGGSSDWLDASRYRPDRFGSDDFPTEQSVLGAMPARR